ncbi:MAG: nuclear transport factor 2 family protein [Bacteroidia bacterium]|nr:nuclear transport factor 2 family protein [Bacteroidia bacterium]
MKHLFCLILAFSGATLLAQTKPEVKEIAAQFLRHYDQLEIKDLANLFAEDATFADQTIAEQNNGKPILLSGQKKIQQMYQLAFKSASSIERIISHSFFSGEMAVYQGKIKVDYGKAGVWEAEFIHVLQIRNGKIQSQVDYVDYVNSSMNGKIVMEPTSDLKALDSLSKVFRNREVVSDFSHLLAENITLSTKGLHAMPGEFSGEKYVFIEGKPKVKDKLAKSLKVDTLRQSKTLLSFISGNQCIYLIQNFEKGPDAQWHAENLAVEVLTYDDALKIKSIDTVVDFSPQNE